MATKKIKKANVYYFTIDNKTKDTVYDVSSKVAKNTALVFNGAINYNNTIYEKKGKDLIISWCLENKAVTSTIKNYFKYYLENPIFLGRNGNPVNPDEVNFYMNYGWTSVNGTFNYQNNYYGLYYNKKGSTYYNWTPTSSTYNPETIYDLAGKDTYNIWNQASGNLLYVYDYAGKDKYKVNYCSKTYINDIKGDDSYELLYGTQSTVHDYAGNDKYNLNYNYTTSIYDKKGNDTYNSSFANDDTHIYDYAGKDVYNINSNYYDIYIEDKKGNDKYNANGGWGDIDIDDYAGNDKYSMSSIGDDVYIDDYKGNDKYNLSGVQDEIDIDDRAGNDKYNISNSYYELYIDDHKGKDNYNIKNSYYVSIDDEIGADTYNIKDNAYYFSINDGYNNHAKSGNDKYNISNFTYDSSSYIYDYSGNEKYNLSNGTALYIDDFKGKDNYVASDISYLDIDDMGSGNDTYKISNSNGVDIEDSLGNETYTLSNLYNVYSGNSNYVYDHDGKDTYKVTNSSLMIFDTGADKDKYTVNKLNSMLEISDDGGKDSLIISSANKKNLVFMTNYTNHDGTYKDDDFSLIIYDKVNKGFAKIDNYYRGDGVMGLYLGTGDGKIETIKAGKSSIKGPGAIYLNSLRGDVVSWLSNHSDDYSSVVDVLQKGADYEIDALVARFNNENI